MKRIRLTLQYDGTAYEGWQSQKTGNTVQDIIESRIGRITGEKTRIVGAGRTDAGVHALGQVAAFSTGSPHDAETFRRALNATLPHDIRVLGAEEAGPAFHPRFDAAMKSYLYFLGVQSPSSAFLFRYVWQVRHHLDLDAMKHAAAMLVGTHDFSSFRGSGCSAKTPVRTVSSIELLVTRELPFLAVTMPGDFLVVRIEAQSFLRHMVRNIVGTFVEIGKGKIPCDGIEDILRAKDRCHAGPTAPANGLFLEKIVY